ncbi:hypothetical protein [Chryseobacterium oryzae]|uniref:Lipoprotein n=1 Tax=Chryseobacterium oryzae TaxID=2929799 RepID=A0ABY4BJR3_9FLAO|nr:hypothetical protein [Chryseobacterium oryzae]UOE39144.1 hypothetical protein MTP08_05085 [Chryseobacterium oryzae]
MKHLLIFLVLLLGCSKKENKNINVYEITIYYIGSRDAPPSIIVLTNKKPKENDFPVVNYQVEKEDLTKIEKICYSEKRERIDNSLVLVEVNKDNAIKKYYFNRKNGVVILEKIKKIASHYNNEFLNDDLFSLQYETMKIWYRRDGKIRGE